MGHPGTNREGRSKGGRRRKRVNGKGRMGEVGLSQECQVNKRNRGQDGNRRHTRESFDESTTPSRVGGLRRGLVGRGHGVVKGFTAPKLGEGVEPTTEDSSLVPLLGFNRSPQSFVGHITYKKRET